jgi:hypothetical protein
MKIMNIGLNTLYDIGSNYIMKLNDREVLVVEDDELRSSKLSKSEIAEKKILQELEKKKVQNSSTENKLSPDEERLIRDLQARDNEVKTHESAHQSAGGGMVGAASYTYQQGPDGKMYAIGGEVSISTGKASSPQEAIANAKQIVAASTAAGDPSPQDAAVASSAKLMQIKAEQQLIKENQEKSLGIDIYA